MICCHGVYSAKLTINRENGQMDDNTSGNGPAQSWAKAIFAITLFVEDLAVAKAFYQRVFELPVAYEDENSAVFKFGVTMINLLKTPAVGELIEPAVMASPASGAQLVFTIAVDDVDSMCAQLAARGVPLLNGPMDRPWGIRTASFQDSDGYIWEIAK